MTDEQKDELTDRVRELAPRCTNLEVEHLGHFRVRLSFISRSMATTVVMGLNEEEFPKDWARWLAKYLNRPLAVIA